MDLIDEKFRRHPVRYVLQSLLATAAIMIVLLLMDTVEHTALIASLGASAFIAFTFPHLNVSKARLLIGGYLVGMAVGAPLGLVHRSGWLEAWGMSGSASLVLLGGLAVGLAIFLMVVTNTEHPPAAGIALGLVVSRNWHWPTLVVIFTAILALAVVKRLLRRFLRDLL